MAAPEKYVDYEFLDDGLGQDIQWVAPQIGSALTPESLNFQDQGVNCGWVFQWSGSALGALYGARKPLPAARDISARRYLWLGGFTPGYATVLKFADLDDGGVRIYLTDSAGAYRGYTIYGRDVSGGDPNPPFAFGSFIAFNNSTSQMWWCIDLDRTPDDASGTLDLTDIVAIEAHVQNNAVISNTADARAAFGYFLASDDLIIRAGEVGDPADFSLLPQTVGVWNTTNNPLYPGGGRQGQGQTPIFDGANGNNWATMVPVHVGDGSTATYFRQGRGTLSAQLSMEAIRYRIALGDTPSLLPCYLPNEAKDRTHTINQSASDDVEFDSFTWSGYDTDGDEYALEVKGSASGSCSILRNSFFRADFVKLAHAQTEDCLFDACNGVEITADTGMTGATIRNAPSGTTALTIAGAAGDYSAIEARLNNPSATYDVALGAGGAGSYDLTGLTVPAGYTLKLRNNSATNAVTVTIAGGITTSTSTAGGTIVVSQPVVRNVASVTNIVAGSRLRVFNETTNAEIANEVIAGTSWTYEYDEGTGFTTGDIINVRLARCTGATASIGYEGTAVAGTTGWSLFAAQDDDAVYNANGIDGTAVTEFSFDYPNVQVDIDDPDGATTITRLYAWWANERTTADGIRTLIGGLIAEDAANYKIVTSVVDLKLDNTASTGVIFTGDLRLYRDDGAAPVVASTTGGGSITLYAGKVYTSVVSTSSPVITGDISQVPAAVQSGLTAQGYTSARAPNLDNITAAPSAAANAAAVRTELATELARIDVATSTRLADADYVEAPAAADNATAVLAAAATTPIQADVRKVNNYTVDGTGTEADPWGPV